MKNKSTSQLRYQVASVRAISASVFFDARVLASLFTLVCFATFSNAFGEPSSAGVHLSPANEGAGFAHSIEFTKHGILRREVPVSIKRQSNEGARTPATAAAPGGCPTTITHSLSQSIVAGNSTACFDEKTGFTRENTYWRAFDMNTFTGGQAYDISSISFGVEQSIGTGIGQDLDVVLWANNGAPFPAGTLEPLAVFFLTIINDSLFTVQIPLDQTTVPAGTLELVMEVSSPDGVANGNVFLIGSNSEGQTGPSYISEPDCGFADPVDLASIGFPDMHTVFNVDGSCPGGTPTPTPTPTSTATPTPTSTPRATPTPRPRPAPHPRPS